MQLNFLDQLSIMNTKSFWRREDEFEEDIFTVDKFDDDLNQILARDIHFLYVEICW